MAKNFNREQKLLEDVEDEILNIFSEFTQKMENFNLIMKNEKGEVFGESEEPFKIVSNLLKVKEHLHDLIDKIYKENTHRVLLNKTFENEEVLSEIENLKKKYNELKQFANKNN